MKKLFIIRIFVLILLVVLFSNCTKTIYYYNAGEYYGIKQGKTFQYYYPGRKYSLSMRYQKLYNETNGFSNLNLDSIAQIITKESLFLAPPTSLKFDIKIRKNMVIYIYSNKIDTIKFVKNKYQTDKKLPFITVIFSPSIMVNGRRLVNFRNKYSVRYIQDSLFFFKNHPMEKIHILHFYPTSYLGGLKIDSTNFKNPVILGISARTGVPVYILTKKRFTTKYGTYTTMNCIDYTKVRCSLKKLKTILK